MHREIVLDNMLLDQYGHIKMTGFTLCKENLFGNSTTKTFCGVQIFDLFGGIFFPEILTTTPTVDSNPVVTSDTYSLSTWTATHGSEFLFRGITEIVKLLRH